MGLLHRIRRIAFFLSIFLFVACSVFFLHLHARGEDSGENSVVAENSLFAEIRLSPESAVGETAIRLQYIKGESREESTGTDAASSDLEQEGEPDRWEAYIPSEDSGPLYIFLRSGYTLRILQTDGEIIGELRTGEQLEPLEQGISYEAQLLNQHGRCTEESVLRVYYSENVASLYLQIDSALMASVNEDRDNSAKCRYALYRADGELDASGECKFSGRGHSTWHQTKKPYNLNLLESKSLLGLPAGTKYCILANVFDHSNLRDWTAQNLAKDLQMPYTAQCEFVNVYIDGAYNGLYLLSQRPRANGGSIEKEQSENLQSGVDRVVIFDGRAENKEYYIQTEHRQAIVNWPGDPSEEEIEEIQSYYQEAEKAVFAENGINEETGMDVSQYLDLDSWAQMYAFQECFAQTDVESFSFYTCMLPGDKHIYCLPMWDFDISGGLTFKGNFATPLLRTQLARNKQNSWTSKLIANNGKFTRRSFQYYQEEILPALAKYTGGAIEEKAREIYPAAVMNQKRWQIQEDPEDLAAWFARWLRDRQEFLLAYWEDPNAWCRVYYDFNWENSYWNIYYYVKKGDVLGYLPALGMESGAYGPEGTGETALGWKDDSGNMVTADLVVNEDLTLYAVWQEE